MATTMTTIRKTWLTLGLCLLAAPIWLLAADEKRPGRQRKSEGLPLVFTRTSATARRGWQRFEFTDRKAWEWKDLAHSRGATSPRRCSTATGSCRCRARASTRARPQPAEHRVGEGPQGRAVRDGGEAAQHGPRLRPATSACSSAGSTRATSSTSTSPRSPTRTPTASSSSTASRVSVATKTTKGTNWDDAWHTVRIVRQKSGRTEVFFDGRSIMTGDRTEFPQGRVGVGSFDDTADFTELTRVGRRGSSSVVER